MFCPVNAEVSDAITGAFVDAALTESTGCSVTNFARKRWTGVRSSEERKAAGTLFTSSTVR
eukprot:10180641-Prorocentrum_lima.AAC.1